VTAAVEAAVVVLTAGELETVDVDPPTLAADARAGVADGGAGALGNVTVWMAGARRAAVRGCRRLAAGCRAAAAGASPEATLSGSDASPIR
jgi:hypothetical protein